VEFDSISVLQGHMTKIQCAKNTDSFSCQLGKHEDRNPMVIAL